MGRGSTATNPPRPNSLRGPSRDYTRSCLWPPCPIPIHLGEIAVPSKPIAVLPVAHVVYPILIHPSGVSIAFANVHDHTLSLAIRNAQAVATRSGFASCPSALAFAIAVSTAITTLPFTLAIAMSPVRCFAGRHLRSPNIVLSTFLTVIVCVNDSLIRMPPCGRKRRAGSPQRGLGGQASFPQRTKIFPPK